MTTFFVGDAYSCSSPLLLSVLFVAGALNPGDLVFVPARGIYLGKISCVSRYMGQERILVCTRDQKYVLGVDFFITDQLEAMPEPALGPRAK